MSLVTVTTPLRPTEDPEKVRKAILNQFPESEITIEKDRVTATAVSLERFKEMIRNQKILDSVRNKFLEGMSSDRAVVSLNKQAGFVNRVSLSEGRSALGSVEVTIQSEDIEALVDEVAPKTVDGVEVK
jgi:uncharacterized protein